MVFAVCHACNYIPSKCIYSKVSCFAQTVWKLDKLGIKKEFPVGIPEEKVRRRFYCFP
jgi:hypothetical protein